MAAKPSETGVASPLSFLELGELVLRTAEAPLTYQEIWKRAVNSGLSDRVPTKGSTPWASLGSQFYVEVRDNPSSRLLKVGKRPAKFFLRSREAELKQAEKGPKPDEKQPTKRLPTERDLHPILAYFAASPSFNRGRSIYTKTIHHETSKKSGYAEWTYPDIVGFSIPIEEWEDEVLALNAVLDRDALTLFSFEMKRELSKATYREAYFQAVSNSSWAHQGYLVAASIDEDDDLLRELQRLASSFGIGIIALDLENPGESRVLYPARIRPNLDWETINKLCDQSKDFRRFLDSVKIDAAAGRIHTAEYDEVKREIQAYVKGLGNGQLIK